MEGDPVAGQVAEPRPSSSVDGGGSSASRRVLAGAARPLRFLGAALFSTVSFVLGYALLGFVVMLAAAGLLSLMLPDTGAWAVVGQWSLAGAYAVVGVVAGGLLGLNKAAARAVARFEAEIREGFERLTPAQAERLMPTMPLEDVRSSYDQALDSMVEQTLGRVRFPRALRRLVRSRLRQAMVEQFLAECEMRGATTVGFPEVRNWLVARGVPLATAPVRAKLRLWRYLLTGAVGLVVAATVVISLPASWPVVGPTIPWLFAAAGAAVMALGLPRARHHASPGRWKFGIVVLGASLAVWPMIYVRLAREDLGLVWLAIVAATIATISFGWHQAFVEADRPRL